MLYNQVNVRQFILERIVNQDKQSKESVIEELITKYSAELEKLQSKTVTRRGRPKKNDPISKLKSKLATLREGKLPSEESRFVRDALQQADETMNKKSADETARLQNISNRAKTYAGPSKVKGGRPKKAPDNDQEASDDEAEKGARVVITICNNVAILVKVQRRMGKPSSGRNITVYRRRWQSVGPIQAEEKRVHLNQRTSCTFSAADPTKGDFFVQKYEADRDIVVIDPAYYHMLAQPCPVCGFLQDRVKRFSSCLQQSLNVLYFSFTLQENVGVPAETSM